ncbi:unnamed protein product, partial [Rotaria magnacalcarata]
NMPSTTNENLSNTKNIAPASFNLVGETTTSLSSLPSTLSISPRDRCRRCQQLVYVT